VANSPQARKRARQADTHNKRNAAARSKFRSAIKKVIHAIEAGDKATAESAYQSAIPVIDSTCAKGLIHQNKAARHKSRLNKTLRAMA
jgi:small subunit ribosomal protein S20